MTDKIKFCPQCNGCLFDDMMTCCVCGYQFTRPDDDLVPLDAYGDCAFDEVDGGATASRTQNKTGGKDDAKGSVKREYVGNGMTMSIDCGSCCIDISIQPK